MTEQPKRRGRPPLVNPNTLFTESQKDLVLGTVITDATLEKKKTGVEARWVIDLTEKNAPYIQHIRDIFASIFPNLGAKRQCY